MKQFRTWITLTLCALFMCLTLAGCMNTGDRLNPDAAPNSSAGADTTVVPNIGSDLGVNPSDAPASFDWTKQSGEVEQKIDMLSEIQSSRVVVSGSTALVGVTFANQYKGEMTQRIHDMVAGAVQEADPAIQTVAVTSEKEDVDRIGQLADRLASSTPLSELEGDIDSIVRNVTTIQ